MQHVCKKQAMSNLSLGLTVFFQAAGLSDLHITEDRTIGPGEALRSASAPLVIIWTDEFPVEGNQSRNLYSCKFPHCLDSHCVLSYLCDRNKE